MTDSKVPALPKQKTKKEKSSKKLLLILFLFFITVLVVLFFQSSLSRITEVHIKGNRNLTLEQIEQASGVSKGDHYFLTLSKKVEENVAKLPTVASVKVTKRFPGELTIEIKEFSKVGYTIDQDGNKQMVMENGVRMPAEETNQMLDRPILTGWSETDSHYQELCKVLGGLSESDLEDISEIRPDPMTAYPDGIKLFPAVKLGAKVEIITTIGFLPEKASYIGPFVKSWKEENNVSSGVIKMLESDSGKAI
ncbi:FtsQ-type POTRA domain-containing protein [Paenibacillus larvae]